MDEKTEPTPLTAEAITGLIATALKPVTEALGALTTNQKVIADTMAADKTKADDAAKAAADAAAAKDKGQGTKDAAQPLTADAVAKLLNDTLSAATPPPRARRPATPSSPTN